MSGIVLREEDGDEVEVVFLASANGPRAEFVSISSDTAEVSLCTSTMPSLVITLASLWREANPDDASPEYDWLRNGVPTIAGRS